LRKDPYGTSKGQKKGRPVMGSALRVILDMFEDAYRVL